MSTKANSAQPPRLMKSTLTNPPKWFVVTRYRIKQAIAVVGPNAGEACAYLVADEKHDVTEQMDTILRAELASRRRAVAKDGRRRERGSDPKARGAGDPKTTKSATTVDPSGRGAR